MDVVSVTELRSQLRDVIGQVRRGGAVGVGAHRKPEVVLLDLHTYKRMFGSSPARTEDVLRSMLVDVAAVTADRMLKERPSGSTLGHHPGDRFGTILSWLWDVGRTDQATLLVADLLAELRYHNAAAPEPGSRITLRQLLRGIEQSLPLGDGPSAEQIRGTLERQVPGFFPTDDLEIP